MSKKRTNKQNFNRHRKRKWNSALPKKCAIKNEIKNLFNDPTCSSSRKLNSNINNSNMNRTFFDD